MTSRDILAGFGDYDMDIFEATILSTRECETERAEFMETQT